ncbi:hypothetical protein AKJ09_10791 [Labilithrix luteola]|uniref:Cell division protein FtsH n=1 Tax=Labilithrix luteola TaxID=1391654 RepID=A0A0K1QEH0_9BACT|nr:choice-of-anchor L domain-containing protein [Labilithrix luteola]AKV04128.1 hypothetical protein AKJ09_10791 [Labilithrix luteola]
MRRSVRSLVIPSFVIAAAAAACSSSNANNGFDPDPNAPAGSENGFGNGSGDGGTKPCSPNPANFDIPGNGCDDDGDGNVDNPPTCDSSLSPNGTAEDFARALGICTKASEKGYGLVSAKFTRGYTSNQNAIAEQHGILPKFGNVIKPREGASLGVLSTGYAQEYDGSSGKAFGGEEYNPSRRDVIQNGKDWGTEGAVPPGFPKAAAGCEQSNKTRDVVTVKLELKAPPNVSGIQFDFNFYSGEWPAYICSPFNDGFIAYLVAKGFNGGAADNISFDKNNNPVSVNNGFFDRCTPNVDTGCAKDLNTGKRLAKPGTSECPGGTAELEGTGFGLEGNWCAAYSFDRLSGNITSPGKKSVNGGATGWLTSKAPVQAGETFTIEFMIWDTGDGILDSTVLLDDFTWAEGAVQTSTERPR